LIAGIIGSSNIILTKYLSEYKDNKYIKIDIYLKIIFSIFILLIISYFQIISYLRLSMDMVF